MSNKKEVIIIPKIVDVEKLKKEILNTSYEVFAIKGYYVTTMKDITDACHMSRTSMYSYYKSKDEIFENIAYYFIDFIESIIVEFADNHELSIDQKIRVLNNRLDKKFGTKYMLTIIFEMWLPITRNESQMFDNIRRRIERLNEHLNVLVKNKIDLNEYSGKDQIQMIRIYTILKMLNEMGSKTETFSDSMTNLITSLSV